MTIRPRPCVECGAKFVPHHPTSKICSDRCRRTRQRRQLKAYRDRTPGYHRGPHAIKGNPFDAADPQGFELRPRVAWPRASE
jgi:hypothetical protein